MPRLSRPWYRQQTGCWMAQVNRRQVKLLVGDNTKADGKRAADTLKKLQRFREMNPEPESGQHTVASIIDLYLTHARCKYSDVSYEIRVRYLQEFAELHGWRRVNDKDCLPFHLESWTNRFKNPWTRASNISIVLRPFNWAVKQRLITANPFRGVSKPAGQPRRPLTEEEFQALLRATNATKQRHQKTFTPGARFRQVLIFLRYTGARPYEMSRLEWSHVDFDQSLIELREHKTITMQRQPKPRIIYLHPVVKKLLTILKQRGEHERFVFLTSHRTPWSHINLAKRMCRLRELAGIKGDAKLYGLRHWFGTRSILNGVDLKTVSELMGHTTTRMTEHYLHLGGQRRHLSAAMLQANAHYRA